MTPGPIDSPALGTLAEDGVGLKNVIRDLAEYFVLPCLLELLVAQDAALQRTDLSGRDGRLSDDITELFERIVRFQAVHPWLGAQLFPACDEDIPLGAISFDLLLALQSRVLRIESQDTQPFRQLPQHDVHHETLCHPSRLPTTPSPPLLQTPHTSRLTPHFSLLTFTRRTSAPTSLRKASSTTIPTPTGFSSWTVASTCHCADVNVIF